MEDDYKLVENEGLFQEYLEMGKQSMFIIDVFLQKRKYRKNITSRVLGVASGTSPLLLTLNIFCV